MKQDDHIVLSLFDQSGNMVVPWAEDGYECYAVDIEADERVRTFEGGRWIATTSARND